MARRKTFEIPGVGHGAAPIPMGAQVGVVFRSSGIPPTNATTGEVADAGAEQVEHAFLNARHLLEAAGLSPDDVVYMDVFLEDDALRKVVNEQWVAWYPDEHDRPARHVTNRELPGKAIIQLQIQAVAPDAS